MSPPPGSAAAEVVAPHTRLVLMRSALTLSPDRGGIFSVLLNLVRLGLGGPVAGGRQYVSWIHDHDFIRAVFWLVDHPEIDGAVNLAAPNPLPQAEFMRALRTAWGMPMGLPATAWMAAIGALALQTETELILKSRRVIPGRLCAAGFSFQFPTWPEGARDLCAR
jgi:NAD dependent epimerase/dehydratase family enzyme